MGTEKNIQLIGAVKAVLKKRLDEKILDLIDLFDKGRTEVEFGKYVEIARQNQFFSELDLLNDIGCQINIASLERFSKPQKERAHEERDLEDYLKVGNNVEKIRSGLKIIGEQMDIVSGRPDLRAIDSNGNKTHIELKMDYYNPVRTMAQLKKYLGPNNDNVIFVAPKIRADLYFTLKDEDSKNRLSFYEVTKSAEGYSFKRITEADFPEEAMKKKIDWEKVNAKRNGGKSNIINFGKKNISLRQIKEQIEGRKPEGANKEESQTEKNVSPYYVIMELNRPYVKNIEKYAKANIQIDEITDAKLKGLVFPERLSHFLYDFWDNIDSYVPPTETLKLYNSHQSVLKDINLKQEKKFADLFGRMLEVYKSLGKEVQNPVPAPKDDTYYEIKLANMKDGLDKMDNLLRECRSSEKIYAMVRKMMRMVKHAKGEDKKVLEALIYGTQTGDFLMQYHVLDLKVARTEALMKVDTGLAFTYLSFNTKNFLDFEKFFPIELPVETKYPDEPTIQHYRYFIADTWIYTAILNDLKVVQSQKPAQINAVQKEEQGKPKPQEETEEPYVTQVIEPLKNDLYSKISASIIINHSDSLTKDTQQRIEYFAQDAIDRYNLSKDNIEQLCSSFSQFRLERRIRKREDIPSELQFRNFFDDITLEYIAKGKVPTEEELEELYTNRQMDIYKQPA